MSEKQTEANRINGQKGGPKSEEGKNISKMNAVTHSLTAGIIVLSTEDKPRFLAMQEAYLAELKPVGIEESDLVEEIIVGKWREKRLFGVESSILELAMLDSDEALEKKFSQADSGTRIAFAMARQHGQVKALELVSRYEGRARRLHQAARKDLDRLQATRKREEPKPEVPKRQITPIQSVSSKLPLLNRIEGTTEPKPEPKTTTNPPEIDDKNEKNDPKEPIAA